MRRSRLVMAPASFFIEDLPVSLLGEELRDPTAGARRFLSPELFVHATAIRDAFHDGGRVKHVCLERVLEPGTARAVGTALDAARFRRHHHADYRIDVAPLETLRRSALRDFCAWLGTGDAAQFHGWLVGWPPQGTLRSTQVQVARARRGDEFAVHVDTYEEGLAAVYNFTRGFGPGDGGDLYFPWKGRAELVVPPRFNTLALFRPRDAPHGVSRLTCRRDQTRFTVTAFFTRSRARG